MRRFFSFRSSSSRSENSNPTASATKAPEDGDYWEPPWEANSKKPFIEKDHSRSQASNNSVLSPEEDLSDRKLRRSLSFSSAAGYSASRQGRSNHERCKSPAPLGDSPHHVSECTPHYRSLTPERYTRTKTENRTSVRQSDADDMLGSTSSSTGYQGSSVNSPCSSPIPLRCRPTRITKISSRNKTLDLYIDGEARDKDSQKLSSDSRKDGCLADNRVMGTGKPPRAQSTAPSSPTYSKASARSYSFREVKDIPHRFSRQDWSRDDLWTSSPKKHTRKNWEKVPNAFPEKIMLKSGDSDSETIIKTECRYEEPMLNPPYDNIHCYSTEEPFVQKMKFSHEGLTSMNVQDHNTDEELDEKKKELEQMFVALSQEDLQLEELENSCLNESTLLQTIRNNSEDRRYLVFELYSQINCRITERNSGKERLKQAKLEIDTQTRRLEKEKNELQSSLEKELDRRSNIWSLKLEKFQSEEQRLRERVRELAEQNVSLQREISLLKGKEVDSRSRILNSETQLNDLTASLKEARTENEGLHQALSELQDRFKAAEEEREFLEIGNKEREKENKELQKLVVRLQRVCSEQDRTINGLRQGYSDEIGKQSTEQGENLTRLQMEQLRLTGVEQMLRKEVESCRSEIESLRHENMCLLDRFQGSGNGHSFSSVKLDMELRARVDCLQAQGLSLLGDNVIFCGDLLNFMKCKKYDSGREVNEDFDGYPVSEYTVKYQDLSRRVGNFKKCLQMIVSIVDEKSNLGVLECSRSDVSMQLKDQTSEGVELELKAETLLTRVLREKLCSKELELEQLHADLASATRAHDVLQSETQRLQDDLSCLTHKANDMELQMLRKNECINQLQHEIKESKKEATATRNILTMVSEERETIREQLKHSKERIMLLNHEVQSLKQSIDELKEDALIKEGQISILRDSMVDKPFDIICSPKSMKEFDMDY